MISTGFSIVSVLIVIIKNYYYIISQSSKYRKRCNLKFSELKPQTKLFISYPFECQGFKLYRSDKIMYPELYL